MVAQKFQAFIGNNDIGFFESLAWVLSTQFIGFGIVGLTRRFLIKPKAMLFPSVLPSIALYTTLHKPDVKLGRWSMSRFKFFWLSFFAIFCYTWIPVYIR